MTIELADDATHEDVQRVVDQIIEDRSGGDSDAADDSAKGDAQRIAEDRDQPVGDLTAETNSGSDDTAQSGEETGDSEGGADWLDDDLKAEVAAYGIDEKELDDFTSREELDRALRFLDRSALEAGRKAMAESDKGETKTPESKTKEGETGQADQAQPSRFEISLDSDVGVYEDDLVTELKRMAEHYESRIDAMEARFAEAARAAEEQHFDRLVDSLGHSDLFGKSGKESPKELERRQELFTSAKAQMIGLRQLGHPVDLDESLLQRVARMAFSEELGKKDLKNRTRRIFRQADRRSGGGSGKTPDTPETAREKARRYYKELEEAGSG